MPCGMCRLLLWIAFLVFFFFKQKTAYEMRISDWSSDVCSSDLEPGSLPCPRHSPPCARSTTPAAASGWAWTRRNCMARCADGSPAAAGTAPTGSRSEEHTSELQSLMRISYAVFCLKKKTHTLDIY